MKTWRQAEAFPATHQAIYDIVLAEHKPSAGPVLNLAVGDQALALRMDRHGFDVHDAQVATRKMSEETFVELAAFVMAAKPTLVVARRVFPELLDALGEDRYPAIPELLFKAGAEKVIVEGRAVSVRSTHPLALPEKEFASLSPWFVVAKQRGPIAVLKRGKAGVR